MKIQCSCGAKFEFEIAPEMATHPVKFVCPFCRVDASEFVDGLVRRELGQNSTPAGVPIPIQFSDAGGAPGQTSAPAPAPTPPAAPAPVRLARATPVVVPQSAAAPADAQTPCLKHPGEFAVAKCYICSKPICPKCMELFGYVCSPLCKAKAESHGINVPVFEGQRSVMEARQWRTVVRISSVVGVGLALFLGVWFWYAWFGRMPKTIFSVRFPDRAFSGHSIICGTNHDQIVLLHGGMLARYDMKTAKQIWSADLIDQKAIASAIEKEREAMKKLIYKANNEGWDDVPKMPDETKLKQMMEREQAAALELHVLGENVWVSSPGKLVRYDWASGKAEKTIGVRSEEFGGLLSRGDELILVEREGLKPMVTSINLASGQERTTQLGAPEAAELASATNAGGLVAKAGPSGGLPTGVPGRDRDKPMDPGKVAEQFQNLPYAAKLALPATLANTMNQERMLKEMEDDNRRQAASGNSGPGSYFSLVPARNGFVQFAVKLVERKLVARSAMKPAPGRSALEGNVSAGKSMDVANEFLNEMQRDRGGDVVQDDLSRYQVTVRNPDNESSWSGEVVGPPKLYPLDTVNVIAAHQTILVLDKSNRLLWQAPLSFDVRDLDALDPGSALYGQAPVVEHKGTLYVMDDGMLTAFDLTNGRAKWRYVSVGVAGMFFDDHDMIYLNTTTASPDSIKFSRQIDITQKVISVIAKLDSRNGAVLWASTLGGMISYVSGKFLYVVESYAPEEQDEDNPYRVETGFEKPPFLHILRINPKTGHQIWEHVQNRAPLDVAFDKNVIRLVFKREVQVLKTLDF